MKKRWCSIIIAVLLMIGVVGVTKTICMASNTTLIVIGKTVKGSLKEGMEDDYSILPSETGQLTITIQGKIQEGIKATIMDETQTDVYRVKTAEYKEDKGNVTIKYVVYVDPIKYHIRISGANTTVNGEYTIKTSFKSLSDNGTKNHSIDNAYTMKNDKYYNGYITIDGASDYYKIKVKQGENLKFSVNCYSESAVSIGIIKPSETFVSITGSAGFNNYEYSYDESVPAGTYTIVISGNGGAQIEEGRHYSIVTGKYTLLKSIKTIANKTLYVGKCYQLKVTKTPSNATETLKYTSSNKKVATVSSNGKITAKAKGTATITMVSEHTGIKKSVKITVKEIAVLKVQITTSPKSIYVGKQLKLSATVTPTDATNSKISWKSSDTSVASVSSKGIVTGKKAGSCSITATAGGKKATYKVMVKAVLVSKVALNTYQTTITEGDSVHLHATVTPSNAQNKEVTFRSSNTSVATVSSNGVVVGKKEGTCVITATAGGKQISCKITVKKKVVETSKENDKSDSSKDTTSNTPEVKSIKMESSLHQKIGDKLKLSISISPTKASSAKLTWKSSDSSIVSVSNGTISCKKEGYATIIVKASNGISAMCTVYVTK